jgi:hypothetical protein
MELNGMSENRVDLEEMVLDEESSIREWKK